MKVLFFLYIGEIEDKRGQYIYSCHIGINNIFFSQNEKSRVIKSNLYYVEHVKQTTTPGHINSSYFQFYKFHFKGDLPILCLSVLPVYSNRTIKIIILF